MRQSFLFLFNHFYRPFGQGNVFTGVCHSVNGGGVPDQAPLRDQAGTPPWDQAGTPPPGPGRYTPLGPGRSTLPLGPGRYTPPGPGRYTPSGPGRYTPQDQAGTPPPGPGRYTPRDQAGTPPPGTRQVPPRTRYTPQKQQTPEYGQRSASTHPTGMHSCYCYATVFVDSPDSFKSK